MFCSRLEWLLVGVVVMMFQQAMSEDPVNGGFTPWSTWDSPDCSVTCGVTAIKHERRKRSYRHPAPAYGSEATEQIRKVGCGLPRCQGDE